MSSGARDRAPGWETGIADSCGRWRGHMLDGRWRGRQESSRGWEVGWPGGEGTVVFTHDILGLLFSREWGAAGVGGSGKDTFFSSRRTRREVATELLIPEQCLPACVCLLIGWLAGWSVCFEIGSHHVALAALELTKQTMLASNS